MLPPEMVMDDTEPPLPEMQFSTAVSDDGAMSMVALAVVVGYEPLTTPSLRAYPFEVWEAPLKVTLEGLRPGQAMVKLAPMLPVDSNALQALLVSFVGFSFTLEALVGPPEGDVVHPLMVLPVDFSVSLDDVAEPGTSGGLKVTVAVKVVQVIVPVPLEDFAEAMGPLTVSRTIGTVTRAATVRDVRRKRICFPLVSLGRSFESER